MRKLTKILLIMCFFIIILCPCVNAVDTAEVYVNGEKILTDQSAVMVNGRTLIPLRAICEALNCSVEWDENTQTAKIRNEYMQVNVAINSYYLFKKELANPEDTIKIRLDVPPVIYNERIMVPARAISEALYAKVDWDDTNRHVNITTEYTAMSDFKYGLSIVNRDGLYGVINENRDVVVPLKYIDISFDSLATTGLIEIKINDNNNPGGYKCGFCDFLGNEVVPLIYGDCTYYSNGKWCPVKKGDKWGVIDTTGNVVINFNYDHIGGFFDGVVIVQNNEQFGLINKNENMLIAFGQYDSISWLETSHLEIIKSEKSGVADLKGNTIIPIQYDDIFHCNAGFGIKQNGKEGAIDFYGNELLPPIYEKIGFYIYSNSSNCYMIPVIDNNGKIGIISNTGKVIFPIKCENMDFWSEELAVVKEDGFWGIVNNKNKTILPMIYDEIEKDDNRDLFKAYKDGILYYFNFNGERVNN